ncbi:toxin-antitoxin system YwqK family antitoxin [Shewanella profunda]|uniref:toxin-antitoxin system YwqK family antitoxin n=1 Tax=Shewanella profunda TaxID=254793 RepID=UPI00200DE73B|nr:toxin-antitoxin system YwqK family antitoxin [Shewanella profunda]MCL1088151.1 toxin-antitoxin system YwqK family antitoxin [Shewanella profunda]
MSLFRALKAKLFNSSENYSAQQDTPPQIASPESPLEPAHFHRHFSLKIHATEALATSQEQDIARGINIYHYDSPQLIELLGWELVNESCSFHSTQFDRLEISNQTNEPEQHFWLGKEKVCSVIPTIPNQPNMLWKVELYNIEALLISRFNIDPHFIVCGDIQDHASLTGKLQRTFHEVEDEHGISSLRVITQTPKLTQVVESNYFGERDGISRQFDALGTLLFEGHFIQDQQVGLQTWFHHTGKINYSEDRRPNGMFITRYHDHGNISETAEIDSDGAYINTLTRFYESGNVQLTRPMVADQIHGIEYLYYNNGSLEAERYYDQGYEYQAFWYHSNGVLKQKMLADSAGKTIEEFYESGQLAWREQFNPAGELHGEHVKWYPNGQLEEKIYFENGKEQGMANWYHDNGQLALEIYLENGLREGLFKSYYKSGVLSAEGQYKNNLSISPFTEYYENQQIQMYLPHTQGYRDGTARWFYEDGTIRTISEYEVRDGQGYLKESSFYNKQGILESYQSHSNTRCGYNLENNQREYYQQGIPDTRIEYYEDGTIRWLLTCIQDNLFTAKSLSRNGTILETGTIQITEQRYLDIGHWQRFTPQGQLLREVWLDEQGQLIESRHYFDFNENTTAQDDDEAESHNGKNVSDGDTAAKQAQEEAVPVVTTRSTETLRLSYHLKFDDESKLYTLKRYHPNSHIAEEGNLQIQGQEQFWVGIHNQYDDQGRIALSETYTMNGERIEQATNTSSIVLN